MIGPKLPHVAVEAPDHVHERDYVYRANYCPPNVKAQIYLESGSDHSPEEALDRLRLGLDALGLIPLSAAVDIDDIDECLEEEPEDTLTEGDYVIQPNGNVARHEYPHGIYEADPDDWLDAWRYIRNNCRQEQFWPNVWRLDDHGGLEIYTADEYPSPAELDPAPATTDG